MINAVIISLVAISVVSSLAGVYMCVGLPPALIMFAVDCMLLAIFIDSRL